MPSTHSSLCLLTLFLLTTWQVPAQAEKPLPTFTYAGLLLHPSDVTTPPKTDELERASIIQTEGRIAKPLGKYYLYYSPHKHVGISLAYSDSIEGPWTQYEGNPVIQDAAIPDVRWFKDTRLFHMWGHRKNKQSELWTSEDGLQFKFHSTSIAAHRIRTRNATYTRAYEYPLKRYDSKYIMLYSGFLENRGVRCVWLAHSKDGLKWTQEKTPLVEPIDNEKNDIYGPSLLQYNGRNFIVYQDHTAYRGGNVKYVELDDQLNPVGQDGTRHFLIEPDEDSPVGNRYRGCEFYREGDTIYMVASGGDDPRRLIYAKAIIEQAN